MEADTLRIFKRPVIGIFPSGRASRENTSNTLLEVGHGGYRGRAVQAESGVVPGAMACACVGAGLHGLSGADYCREHGLHPTSFYRWKRRLRASGDADGVRGETARARGNGHGGPHSGRSYSNI